MKEGETISLVSESYFFTVSVPNWIPIAITIAILLIVVVGVRRHRNQDTPPAFGCE